MKNLKFHKIGFVLILALLMSFYPVNALGITRPILEHKSLLRGGSTRFYFEIQAIGSQTKLSCGYYVSGLDPLIVSFDQEKVEVNAGEIKNVYGTVSVPADATLKTYEGTLAVNCEPMGLEVSGSLVKQIATLFFPSVSVVSEVPQEETPQTIPVEEKPTGVPYSWFIIILIIVIIAIGTAYWFNKEKKKK